MSKFCDSSKRSGNSIWTGMELAPRGDPLPDATMTTDVDELRPPSRASAVPAAPAILLVDDQPARLLTYEAVLSGLDVRCVRAQSGENALEKLRDEEFAVVLLDVNMPGMDGFEVARRLRGRAQLENIPIIFVTGLHDTPLDRLRGYEVGAIDYITLPIVPEVLRSKVAILVELHRRRTELELLNRQLTVARDSLAAENERAREEFVAALRETNQALRESQQRLQLADRRKDEFLAMLAHELRNPVAPIRSAAEALAQIHPDDERTRGLASIVQRQVLTLSRLLDDLLDVARITQGRIQLHLESVPVQACIELALETVGHCIGQRHHDLVIERSDEPLYASADRVRLAQCLGNLLANAAKYTEPGGQIRIRSHADGNHAVIEVCDNGQGIAAEFLPQMFDLFAQSDRALDRAQGGLGVGLCVCRELMEMQKGSVSGASPGPGRGATFSLRLPLAQSPEVSAQAVMVYQPVRRILIVDDNRDAADALATLLQMEGHEVQTVYEAEAGLARLTSFVPDIALLDIGLPCMDGYELAAKLRQRNVPNLKLVAISGYGQPEDRARSKAVGFDVHLVKPVDFAELRKVLCEQQPRMPPPGPQPPQ